MKKKLLFSKVFLVFVLFFVVTGLRAQELFTYDYYEDNYYLFSSSSQSFVPPEGYPKGDYLNFWIFSTGGYARTPEVIQGFEQGASRTAFLEMSPIYLPKPYPNLKESAPLLFTPISHDNPTLNFDNIDLSRGPIMITTSKKPIANEERVLILSYKNPFSSQNSNSVMIRLHYNSNVHDGEGSILLQNDEMFNEFNASIPGIKTFNDELLEQLEQPSLRKDYDKMIVLKVPFLSRGDNKYNIFYRFKTLQPQDGVSTMRFIAELVINDELFQSNGLSEILVTSQDPNEMTASPSFLRSIEIHPDPATIIYTIEYQNYGSISAEYVKVENIIPPELSINSFRFLESKYPANITQEGNYLRWEFLNTLPGVGEISHLGDINYEDTKGWIRYAIDTYTHNDYFPEFSPNERIAIRNQAAITFDNNDPIITRGSILTIEKSPFIGIGNRYKADNIIDSETIRNENLNASIIPNPFTTLMNIELLGNNEGVKVEIYDLTGLKVADEWANEQQKSLKINAESWKTGIYFVQISSNSEVITKKVYKAK